MEIRILDKFKKESHIINFFKKNITSRRCGWNILSINNDVIKIDIYVRNVTTSLTSSYDIFFVKGGEKEQYNIRDACDLSKECSDIILKLTNKIKIRNSTSFMRWIAYYYEEITSDEIVDIYEALKEVKTL